LKSALEVLAQHGLEIALVLSLVLALGALAVRCTRSPVQRHHLVEWTLGIALLAAPLLILPLPRLRAHAVAPVEERAPTPPTGSVLTRLETSSPATIVRELPGHMTRPAPSAVVPSARDEIAHGGLILPPTTAKWLSIGFLLGAVGFALHLSISLWLLRRLVRHARPAPGWLVALVPDLGSTRVLVSSETQRPFCFGLGAGTILLPATLVEDRQEHRLRVVLLHEQAHLAQRHGRARLIAAIAAPLFYWQPLFWWLVRAARQDAELVADDIASGSMDKREYAAELLGLVESTPRARLAGTLGLGALGSRNHFLERMETLIMRSTPLTARESRMQFASRTTLALVLLATVTMAWGRTPQEGADHPQDVDPVVDNSVPILSTIPQLSQFFGQAPDIPNGLAIPILVELPGLSDRFSDAKSAQDEVDSALSESASEVDVEFRFGELGQLQRFQQRIAAAGGRFVITAIREPESDGAPIEGKGRILDLSREQRTPIRRFLSDDWHLRGSSDFAKEARRQLEDIDGEIQALSTRLAELRLQRAGLEDALAREAAAAAIGRVTSPVHDVAPSIFLEQVHVIGSIVSDEEPAILGKILNVADSLGVHLVVVDRGREQGVKVGTTFEVYSGSTYKGRVEVTDVKPST